MKTFLVSRMKQELEKYANSLYTLYCLYKSVSSQL